MEVLYEENSQSCSSLFAAPSEQMVASGVSVGMPTIALNEEERTQVKAYLAYWDDRVRNHPLLRYVKKPMQVPRNESLQLKFDYERFLAPYDAALKLLNKGIKKLPSNGPPKSPKQKLIRTKRGDMIWVADPLATVYDEKNQNPNAVFYWTHSLTNPDRRDDCIFTYGNVEAALRIMRYYWSKNLKCKKPKQQMAYDILPVCYEMLRIVQTELNGYQQDKFAEYEKVYEATKHITEEEHLANWIAQDQCIPQQVPFEPMDCKEYEQAVQDEYQMQIDVEDTYDCDQMIWHSTKIGSYTDVDMIEFPLNEVKVPEIAAVDNQFSQAFYNDEPGVQSDDPEKEERPEGEPMRKRRKHRRAENFDQYLNEEAAIMFIKEQLYAADRLGITCKCYYCVKAFVRRSRCCPRNQYRNPQDCPHILPDKRATEIDENTADVAHEIFTQAGEEPLETVETVQTDANITFVNERPVGSDDTHVKSDMTAPDVTNSIAENRWSLQEILTRPIMIENFAWTEKDIHKEYAIPKSILDIQSLVRHQISYYGFLRSGVRIKALLNGTRFHQGRLVMYYVPPLWSVDRDYYTRSNVVNFPHQFLDASVSNVAELEIPYTHLLSYMPVESKLLENDSLCTLGRVCITTWNSLKFASGSSAQLNVTVYGQLINPEVHQPVKLISNLSFSNGLFTQAGEQSGQEGVAKRGWMLDSFIGGLSAGAARLTGGLVTGGLRVLAGMIFDKPTVPLPPLPMVNMSVAAPCHGAGLDDATRLSLSPISLTETPPQIIGGTDPDFDILTLCKMPSRTFVGTWSADHTIGKILQSAPVCPVYTEYQTRIANSGSQYTMSMLGYVSRSAALWRGPIVKRFEFITTQLQSGRIGFVYDPTWAPGRNSLARAGESFDVAGNQNLNWIIIDIQEQKEIEIVIPFMSPRPWLRCDSIRMEYNTKQGTTQTSLGQAFNGAYYLVVMNPLVSPSNVSNSVEFNEYTYAGDGYELAIPNSLTPLMLNRPDTQKAQYGAELDYPYVKGLKTSPWFENRERIDNAFYGGYKLYLMHMIASEGEWYESKPTALSKEDAFSWLYEVSHLKRYLEDTFTGPQTAYMKAFPKWEEYTKKSPSTILTQSAEQQLADRNPMVRPIIATKGFSTGSAAPMTVSENMMNLSTLLKRKYPLIVMDQLHGGTEFTLVTLPVTPTFKPEMRFPIAGAFASPGLVNHLAWYSALYTYWRGSIDFLVMFDVEAEIFVWFVPTDCRKFQISHGYKSLDIQRMMSFAGTMAEGRLQGSISVQCPFQSPYNQCLCDIKDQYTDLRAQNGTLYIAFRNLVQSYHPPSLSVFISAGEDLVFNLLRCAPTVYEYQFTISDCEEAVSEHLLYPETQRNIGDDSDKYALPGSTGIKNLDGTGNVGICTPAPAPPRPLTQGGSVTDFPRPVEPNYDTIPIKYALAVQEQYKRATLEWQRNRMEAKANRKAKRKKMCTEPIFTQALEDYLLSQNTKAKFEQATNSMTRAADSITLLATTASASLASASDIPTLAGSTLQNLNELSQTLNSKLSPSSSYPRINNYVDISVNIVMVYMTINDCHAFFESPSTSKLLHMAMSFAGFLGYNFSETLKTLLHSVADWIIGHVLPRAQALNEAVTEVIESAEEGIIPAVAVIGTLLYAYIFDCLPSFEKIKKMIKEFFGDGEDDSPKTQGLTSGLRNAHFSMLGLKALDSVYEKLCELLKKFLDWILERENPTLIAQRKAGEHQDRLLRLIADIDELDYEPTFMEAMRNSLVHNRFYKMMDEANDLFDIAIREKLDPKVFSLIKESRDRARQLIKRLEGENSTSNFRYDPFVVCLTGDTGTCKTEVMHEVSRVIAEAQGAAKYNLIYNRTVTKDGFMNGYKNQTGMEWDEFGQNIKDDETEIGLFVNFRGNSPMQVSMAALDDKGRNFTSQFIVMTTNNAFVHYTKAVRTPEAFLRRRHLVIGCQHRPGVDVHTLQDGIDYDPEFGQIVYASLHNISGEILRANIGFRDMLAMVKTKAERWHQLQMNIKAARENENWNLVMPRGVIPHNEQGVALPILTPPPLPEIRVVPPPADDEFDVLDDQHAVVPLGELRQIQMNIENDDDDFHLAEENHHDGAILAQAGKCRCTQSWTLKIKPNQTEDELFEAQLFLNRWKKMTCCERTMYMKNTIPVSGEKDSTLYETAKRVFATFKEKISNFISEHPKIASVMGLLTLFSTSGLLIWKLLSRNKELEVEAAHYSSEVKTVGRSRVMCEGNCYNSEPGKIAKPRVVTEGSEDPQAMTIAQNVHPYVVPVRWVTGEKNSFLHALHIGGTVILIPYHFMAHATSGSFFELGHRVKPVRVEFQEQRMVRLNNNDWCVYDCGPRLEPRKMMIKYFVPEDQLAKVKSLPAILLCETAGYMIQKTGIATAVRSLEYQDAKYGDVYKQSTWRVNMSTQDGDCGSPLVGLSNLLAPPGKILGIHVAGRTNKAEGFSVLITREKLQQAWDLLVEQKQNMQVIGMPLIQELDQSRPLSDCKIIPEGDYSLYGVLPNKLCPIQPAKTAFVKTPFHEKMLKEMECPKIPAKLMPFEINGERISPLAKALKKYGHETIPFSSRNICKAVSYVKDICMELKYHQGKRIFSEQEAIAGIPGLDEFQRINMKSSAGWPYQVLNKQASGKWYLFDDENNIVNRELRERLDKRLVAARNGERVPSLWRDCLKDELRPVEKVLQGKTRLFTIAPVDFTILVRRYFMDFCIAFYHDNVKFFSAVGITPESIEWTDLYNYLREYGDNIIAGDFETFDGKLMPELIHSVAEIINDWYDDGKDNANVRRVLINEMIHTMQLVENTVYATHQGNPSGNPLTVIVNTIVNMLYMSLAWLEIYPGKTLDEFGQAVRVIAYGDDNVLSVKPGYEHYNQGSITRVLQQHNIGYTSESKADGDALEYRSLRDVTFLKRGFHQDVEFGKIFWLPTMSKETLNSFLFYYRSSPDTPAQLQENMRNGLMFASFHGREYYNEYKNKWTKLMRESQITPVSITFEEQVDVFLHTCGLQRMRPQEGGVEKFMRLSNSKIAKTLLGMAEAPAYYLCAALGILAKSDESIVRNDSRYAVAIPSGEGKSYLCKLYPKVFVDHDDLLINQMKLKKFLGSGNPWKGEIARQYDFPPDDKRILLVHHPDNTNRQVLGSFITQFPNFVRINAVQRLLLKTPVKMDRNSRNAVLVQMAREVEPSLFE